MIISRPFDYKYNDTIIIQNIQNIIIGHSYNYYPTHICVKSLQTHTSIFGHIGLQPNKPPLQPNTVSSITNLTVTIKASTSIFQCPSSNKNLLPPSQSSSITKFRLVNSESLFFIITSYPSKKITCINHHEFPFIC